MATESNLAAIESAASTETSLGPDGNIIALVAYLFAPLSGALVYFLEDDNRFARYHGAQSIVFGVVAIAVMIPLTIVTTIFATILAQIPAVGPLVASLIMPIISLAFLAVWLFLLFKAYQGTATEIPVVTSLAKKFLL